MRKDNFNAAIKAIRLGNRLVLEKIARTCETFPLGEDDLFGERWIIHAIVDDAVGAIRWMIDRGVSVDSKNSEGFSPLHACIEHSRARKREVFRMLLDAGCDVDQIGFNGWSPLHMAAVRNDVCDLNELLNAGANEELRSEAGLTALEEAEQVGSMAAVKLLQKRENRNLI